MELYSDTFAAVEAVEAQRSNVEYQKLEIGDALAREVRSGDVSEPATYRAVSQELNTAGYTSGYFPGDLRDLRITAERFSRADRSRYYKAGVSLETLKIAARDDRRVELLEDLVLLVDAQNLVNPKTTVLDRAILQQLRNPKAFTDAVIRYLPGRKSWTPNERAFRMLIGMSSKDGTRATVTSPEQVAGALSNRELFRSPEVRAAIRQAQEDEHREALAQQSALLRQQQDQRSQDDRDRAADQSRISMAMDAHRDFANSVENVRRYALQALAAWANCSPPPVSERVEDVFAVQRALDAVQALADQVSAPSFDEQAADLLGGGL